MNKEPMTKEKMVAWKNFWESETGEIALSKMHQLEQLWINETLEAKGTEQCAYSAGRAAGIRIVIEDIEQGIAIAKEEEKK